MSGICDDNIANLLTVNAAAEVEFLNTVVTPAFYLACGSHIAVGICRPVLCTGLGGNKDRISNPIATVDRHQFIFAAIDLEN